MFCPGHQRSIVCLFVYRKEHCVSSANGQHFEFISGRRRPEKSLGTLAVHKVNAYRINNQEILSSLLGNEFFPLKLTPFCLYQIEDLIKYIHAVHAAGKFNQLVYNYPIRIPERFSLVIRSLLTQEGICFTLKPDFKFLEVKIYILFLFS